MLRKMNTLEEQPLVNSVVLPEPVQGPLEENQTRVISVLQNPPTTHCFFCRNELTSAPQIQLMCNCKFHTTCFLERQIVFDEDNYDYYEDRLELVEVYLRNHCPLCAHIIYNVNAIREQNREDTHVEAVNPLENHFRRNRRRRNSIETSFLEKYNSDKKCKNDVKNLKKVIAQLRKNYAAFDKKRKLLSQEFQTEIDPLKKLIQQIQKNSLAKLNTIEELKAWKSSRARFEYFKRKFIADHKITDFNGVCKIKQLRLPNRWTLYKLLTGGRYYYRRYRQFGCRI